MEERFGYHHLLFSVNPYQKRLLKPEIPKQIKQLIVFGPCTQESVDALRAFLADSQDKRLYWLTDEGNLQGDLDEDPFFNHPNVYLKSLKQAKAAAFECAKTARSLEFAEVLFKKPNAKELKGIELFKIYFILFYYVFLEKQRLPFVAKTIFSNLQHTSKWIDYGALEGAFKGIPSIIVGAGISLERSLEHLKRLSSHVLIIAAGSSVGILEEAGIRPDIAVCVDPNPTSFERLNHKIKAPLLFTSLRMETRLFKAYKGYKAVMPSCINQGLNKLQKTFKPCPIQKLLPEMATTAVSTAFGVARHLGASLVYLVGVDMIEEGEGYAGGIESQESKLRFIPEIESLNTLISRFKGKVYHVTEKKPFTFATKLLDLQVDEGECLIKPDIGEVLQKIPQLDVGYSTYLKELEESLKVCHENWSHPLREVVLEDELAFQELLFHQDHPPESFFLDSLDLV